MRRIKILGCAFITVLAMSGVASGAASAKSTLDLTWNYEINQLKPLEEFKMDNTGEVTIALSGGGVTTDVICQAAAYPDEQGFVGWDETNDEATDRIAILGAFGAMGEEQQCSGTTTLGSNPWVLFEPGLETQPWGTLSLSSTGRAKIKGDEVVEMLFPAGGTCNYLFSKLTGTWTGIPHYKVVYINGKPFLVPAGDVPEINFTNQKMSLSPFSETGCPTTARLTAPFQYSTTDGASPYFVFEHLGT
jgi:hypothetical protein